MLIRRIIITLVAASIAMPTLAAWASAGTVSAPTQRVEGATTNGLPQSPQPPGCQAQVPRYETWVQSGPRRHRTWTLEDVGGFCPPFVIYVCNNALSLAMCQKQYALSGFGFGKPPSSKIAGNGHPAGSIRSAKPVTGFKPPAPPTSAKPTDAKTSLSVRKPRKT